MPLDWNQGALAEGLRCYRNRNFFLAHEHWESVWLRGAEPEKSFLQALIQIAAALHHLDRGNRVGAASLLRRALQRLDAYPAVFGGVCVHAVRESLRAWLIALDSAGPPAELPFPPIQ